MQGQKRTKSERMREVPLGTIATEALRAERTRQEEWRSATGADWEDSGYVFTTPLGGPVSPDALRAAFRYIAEKAMLASGADPVTVARILGP